MADENKRLDRRKFFREGFAELLRPLAKAISPLERVAHQIGNLEQSVAGMSSTAAAVARSVGWDIWLRPPGALPDKQFRETCSRCAKCVEACPAHCIIIDTTGKRGNGAPYIDANAMACVVCEHLSCMQVCPSGALVPTVLVDIDMGTAVWDQNSCLRTRGDPCTICVDHCPIGTIAIEIRNGLVAVDPPGCVGCGVCQHDCPTTPKSITIIPKAARTAGRQG